MPRYKLILEYDGTGFAGWQKQKDDKTLQSLLEDAIEKFSQQKVDTVAAGRTDAGVHARGQVVSFDLEKDFDEYNVVKGINYYLQKGPLSVISAQKVDDEFSARFSAKERKYSYYIINRPSPPSFDRLRAWHVKEELDIKKMEEAAKYLVGNHDFTSFRASECQAKSPVKTIDKITIEEISKYGGKEICITIEAKSFLHHMVRNIVGTLRLAGNGKWKPEDVKKALEAKDRSAAGPTAPPHGLYFMEVIY